MRLNRAGGASAQLRPPGGDSGAGGVRLFAIRSAARFSFRLAAVTACLAAALLYLFPHPGEAAQGAPDFLQLPDSEKGIPLLVQADEMIYDNDTDRVTASGHVEVYYDKYALTANQVIYDKRNDTVTAVGNVRMTEPDGNVVFADTLKISGNFREGFVRSLSVLTPENARIAAESAKRLDGNVLIFNKAVYTACEVDPERPKKAPIWQIKAVKIIHNQKEQVVEYEDVTFELGGVPIAKIPYFRHADPTVKRKSGFLAPSIGHSDQLGYSAEVPYFWAIAPNKDFTFSPRVLSKQGVLWKGEWRHRTINGSYYIRPAGIHQDNPAKFAAPGNRRWRGSVETAGEFRINEYWTTGWDITAASDDTFLRVYDLNEETEHVSNVHLTGMSERNYFKAEALHLNNTATPPALINPVTGTAFTHPVTGAALPLGTPINPGTGTPFIDPVTGLPLSAPDQALVHPVIDYNYLFDQPVMGGELGFNMSAYSLSRDVGPDSTRLIGEITWRRTFTSRMGQQFTPFFNFRGDVYRVNDVFDANVFRGLRNDETVSRAIPTAGLEYTYPFVATTERATHILEPIAQIITRPDEENARFLPNEDAQSLVFDDTLLFDHDKFSGFDRVEGGTRANVGVRYTIQTNEWGYGTVLLGQSFQLAGTNPYSTASGLGTKRSDYVGAVFLEPGTNFGFSSQFRLDNTDLDLRRHEVRGWARVGPAYGSVTYAKDKRPAAPGILGIAEEVSAAGSLSLGGKWRLFGNTRYDIANKQTVQSGVGVGYFCDCMTVRIDYKQDYFQDRDKKPNRTVTLQIDLKSLGGTTFGTSVGNSDN